MNNASDAGAEEFEKKQKELEAKYNPIMMRVYQAAGGALQAQLQPRLFCAGLSAPDPRDAV